MCHVYVIFVIGLVTSLLQACHVEHNWKFCAVAAYQSASDL